MKALRRGKRRNTGQAVRDMLLDTVPWAVLEEEASVVLAPLSVGEEFLFEPNNILERMVERENMLLAYKRVVSNKGASGVDKMQVEDLKCYLNTNWASIKVKLLSNSYRPQPVRRVEIPKPKGGVRKLGIPTVIDRLIQQALHQVLEPIFDPHFSESSYGFRRKRSAQQAVVAFRDHVASGKRWVVDVDLEKFFDLVDHDILLSRIGRRVKDQQVLKLIRKFLKAGVLDAGVKVKSAAGTPQGGPLSPLLSNIILDDLDKELERRGHSFSRYADDVRVYVGSKKSGERVMTSLVSYLETKLKLKVNQAKSQVAKAYKTKFLGYGLTNHKQPKLRVPKESVNKFKSNFKAKCRSGRGRNLGRFIKETLNKSIRGWINYFRCADVKSFAKHLDSWIRHRMRNIKWRQWKRAMTRKRELKRRGLSEIEASKGGLNRRGPWWNSGALHMNLAFTKRYFDKVGLVSMLDTLLRYKTKLKNRRGT